jgi:hypothetical protein
MKKRVLIGFLLSAALLYLFFRNIDIHEVWQIIRQGDARWLLLAFVMNLLNYFVRSLRWRYFFRPIKKIGVWNSFYTTVIGFSVSAIFPARLGEVVRPVLLGNKEKISKSAALATVVVERLFDTLTILIMLVFYLIFLLDPDKMNPEARSTMLEVKEAGFVLFFAVLGIVVFLFFLKRKPAVKAFVRKIERILPKRLARSLDSFLDSFIEGLSILEHPRLLIQITVWSVLLWMVISTTFWAVCRAYFNFSFPSTFLIMIVLAIGIAIPTPAGVGSYHLACKIGLTRFFHIPDAQAGAVAVVSHFINFVPITLLGLLFLWKEGLSAARLSEMTNEPETRINPHWREPN